MLFADDRSVLFMKMSGTADNEDVSVDAPTAAVVD
jgi:hypothetical protein